MTITTTCSDDHQLYDQAVYNDKKGFDLTDEMVDQLEYWADRYLCPDCGDTL